ncbi:hypothetical protein WJX73_006732 [Symbiochloris irregularis]|uniref:Uncharacterized protein n=1 Tax=Symbiochloris irregularis TaxID=706552 RepID=A0AAW1NQY5_9CHLO
MNCTRRELLARLNSASIRSRNPECKIVGRLRDGNTRELLKRAEDPNQLSRVLWYLLRVQEVWLCGRPDSM